MQEKRRFKRWLIDWQGKMKLAGAETFVPCDFSNLSFQGIQISTKLKLPKDICSDLKIVLSEDCVFEVEAKFVWHKAIDVYNTYGLYFSKIRDFDKEKIYKFIYVNFPAQVQRQWWQEIKPEKGGEQMSKANFIDRRMFDRFAVDFPALIKEKKTQMENYERCCDISAGGAGLLAKNKVIPNTRLELCLNISNGHAPYHSLGRVVWAKQVQENRWRLGLEFDRIDFMGLRRILDQGGNRTDGHR